MPTHLLICNLQLWTFFLFVVRHHLWANKPSSQSLPSVKDLITEGLTGLCSCLRAGPRIWLVVFPTPHVIGVVLLLVHGFSVDLLAKTVLQTSVFGCSGLFLITGVFPNAKTLAHPFILYLLVVTPGPSCWPCPSSGFSCLVLFWLDHDLGYHLTELPDAWPSFWSWSICSLYWHSVVPIQSIGFFRAWYLGVFFCVSWCQLRLWLPALGFSMSSCPGLIIHPSKRRSCTKSHQKLPPIECLFFSYLSQTNIAY